MRVYSQFIARDNRGKEQFPRKFHAITLWSAQRTIRVMIQMASRCLVLRPPENTAIT
jgi:hypothetical protein